MVLDESQQQMVIFMGPGGSNCYLRMRTWLEYGQYIWMSCEENDRGNEGGNMMAIMAPWSSKEYHKECWPQGGSGEGRLETWLQHIQQKVKKCVFSLSQQYYSEPIIVLRDSNIVVLIESS